MRRLIIIFVLVSATFTYGQNSGELEAKYSWEQVIKYVRKNEMDVTKGTQEIVSEIIRDYVGEEQQLELVTFYKDAFDYKIVDKTILKNIIDSLANYGTTDKVKSFAAESIKLIEYRLLSKKIRDLEFYDKDDQLVKLTDFRDKIVIIELWATWCGPCVKDMPKIPELRKQNSEIEFYSISLDKSPDKMKKFVKKNNYDWPIVFGGDEDSNKELWDYLKIVAIPKYYTVDRNGFVINVADRLDENYILGLK